MSSHPLQTGVCSSCAQVHGSHSEKLSSAYTNVQIPCRRVEAVVTSLRWWMTWWWPGVSSSQLLAGCRDCTVEGIEQTSDRFCTTERKNEQMELHVTISFSFLKWVKERMKDEVGKQMVSLAFFQSTDQIWFHFFLKFEVCPSFLKSVSKHTKINTNKTQRSMYNTTHIPTNRYTPPHTVHSRAHPWTHPYLHTY